MSDVLDISNSTDFEHDEEGDRGINNLKTNAQKRKGRGLENKENNYENQDMLNKIHEPQILRKYTQNTLPQKSIEGWVLFITGIHEEATENDIFDKFSESGAVKSVRINLDRRTGFMKSYALIEYFSFEDALRTKELFDETDFLGCKIQVNWCFIKGSNKIKFN